jgi:hypothetical protein
MKHMLIIDSDDAIQTAAELAALRGEGVSAAINRALHESLALERAARRAAADRALVLALHPKHLGPSSALLSRR